MTFMNRGEPLTADESEHVLSHLVGYASAERGWSGVTSDFIRELGWPQRRMPDVRGFLESESTRVELSKRLGASVAEVFMSRSQVFVRMGEPRDRPAVDLTKVEAMLKDTSTLELFAVLLNPAFPTAHEMVCAEVGRRLAHHRESLRQVSTHLLGDGGREMALDVLDEREPWHRDGR
jgi:hypothetical protein